MKPKYRSSKFINSGFGTTLASVITICFGGSTFAADRPWTGATSTDWTVAANWTGGLPGGGDNAVVNVNSVSSPVVNNNTAAVNEVWAGNGGGTNGRIELGAGGTITANGWTALGRNGGTGTLNMSGGNLNNGGGSFIIGAGGGTNGTLNMTGGAINSTGQFWVSENGTGVATVTNGTITAGNQIDIGRNDGGNGTMTLGSGSSLSNSNGNFNVANKNGQGGTTTGSLTLNGNAAVSTANGEFRVGQGGGATGTLTVNGGTIAVNNWISIGREGGNGTVNMNGGSFTKTGGGAFIIGDGSAGTVTQTGGTINSGGSEYWIGSGSNTGSHTISSGNLNVGNWLSIGRNGGTGTLTQTGGTVTKTGGGSVSVGGGNGTHTGTVNVSGGLFDIQTGFIYLGENGSDGTNTLTLSAAGQVNTAAIHAAFGDAGCIGNVNLNGGTLRTALIDGGNGTANVHFNGTQIVATADSGSNIGNLDLAQIDGGNLKIDSNGKTISSAQPFTGAGGIVKTGAGTFTLTGTQSYTGLTDIQVGKMVNTSAANSRGAFAAASGAILGVTTVTNNEQLLASNVTLPAGSSVDLNLGNFAGNATNAALDVSGSLTTSGVGTITLNITDTNIVPGTVPLINYVPGNRIGAATFVLGTVPLGLTVTLNDVAGLVSLTVENPFLWTGTADAGNATGAWAVGGPVNWKDLSTNLNSAYVDGAPAYFNDDPVLESAPTAITLDVTVRPAAVFFDNATAPYSISGSGKISNVAAGVTKLTKTKAGTLSLLTANDYTGATILAGGVTSVNLLANAGVASSIGAASVAPGNLVLSSTTLNTSATLNYTGGTATSSRGFTAGGADAAIAVGSGVNLTLGGQVVGNTGSSFNKQGPGTLTLSNASVTLGAAGQVNEVLAGTLAFTGTASVPGELWVGSVPGASANLIVNSGSLNVGSWLALGRGNGNSGLLSTITATNSTIVCSNFSTGFDNGLPNDSDQTVTVTNTTWTNNGATLLAESANSTTNMTIGGTSVFNANGRMQMAFGTDSVANVTIQDSGSLVQNGGWLSIGNSNNGVGTMTVKDSGNLSTNVDINVSDVDTSNGTLNIQNNATVSATALVFVGKNGGTTGTVNMSGGTFTSSTYITIGRRPGSTGSFNLSGGTVSQTEVGAGFAVGENGNGTLTVSGTGTLDINGGGLYLSAEGTGTSHSVVNLNGGTIIARRVVQRDFNAANYTEFHFNGGILRAHTGASTDFMSAHDLVSVDAGGAFIDSNGQPITIAQDLGGVGGLTKQGAGTLTLAGTDTYTGNTTVSAGTLAVSNNAANTFADSSTVTIVNSVGAVLSLPNDVTDTVASLVVNGSPLANGTYGAIGSANPSDIEIAAITGTGRLQVGAGGFNSWRIANGAGTQAPDADHDLDGVSNGVEFFVGGGTGFTALPSVVDNAGTKSVTWPKSAGFTGTYEVQVSTDLSVWSPAPNGTVVDNGTSVKFTFPAGPAIRFARLSVVPQ